MNRTALLPLLLVTTTTLAACGGGAGADLMRDATGRLRLRAQTVTPKLAAALQDERDVSLVVALDGDPADVTKLARAAREGAAAPQVVAFDRSVRHEPMPDALVVVESGAQVALELALMACAGADVPKTPIPVGPRIVTRANEAAGGELHAAPGDFVVQLLRLKHAAALQPGPAKSVPLLVITPPTTRRAQHHLEPVIARLNGELFEAAAAWPQLDLLVVTSNTGNDSVRQELAQGDYRALIAFVDRPETAKAILEQADGLPVVLIDPELRELGAPTVGCSTDSLGRAAAEAIAMLQPNGCAFVTTANDKRARSTVALRDAVFGALHLQKP